jgi:hypothetical protein
MLRGVDLTKFREFGRPFLFLYAKAMLIRERGNDEDSACSTRYAKSAPYPFDRFSFLKIE